MTYAGADGHTAAEMEETLYLGTQPGVHESFAALLSALADQTAAGDGFDLELANAIWSRSGLPISDDFIRTIATDYDGAARSLDFSDPDQARQIINAWVEDKTRGRVKDLVERLSPETIMVLTNSIYFQADWTTPFDPEMTDTMGTTFFLNGGRAVEASMMYSEMVLPFTYLDGFQVLEMPLEWGRTSMVLVLPVDSAVTPNQLTPELLVKVDDWLESPRRPELMDVMLPKFTTTVSTQLERLLAGMGMPSAFDAGTADFSKITPYGAFIDQVHHKAFFEIHEQGTEAAAATEVDFVLCFAAGTPVLTPDGEKPIEQIQAGDYVISKDEFDVAGKLERKRVEATFRGHAELLVLHFAGQTIRATKEHRFFAQGKGWTPLGELRAGDLLATDEGSWIPVEGVAASGEIARVYNFRVADHHTYFVGGQAWKFAVWTHNEYLPTFRADRPFHFLIRDNVTTATLFMGRIDDPTQSENELVPNFIPSLTPSVSGTVYFDANQDGVREPTEPGLEDWTVFIDANRNGMLDDTEQQSMTGPDGSYSLTPALFSGTVVVALAQQDGEPFAPSHEVMLAAGQQVTGLDIGSSTEIRLTSQLAAELDATSGDDTILLRRNGDNLEVFLQDPLASPPAISEPVSAISSLKLRMLAGDDEVVIDYSGGNPIPSEGLYLDVGGGRNTLRTMDNARGKVHVSGGTMDIGADPRGISLYVDQDGTVRLNTSAHLAAVHVTDNGKLVAQLPGQVLRAHALTIGPRASLRLNGGPLIVDRWVDRYWSEAQLNQYIHNGQLHDNTQRALEALVNDVGDWTLRFETIAGEEVDVNSVVVTTPLRAGVAGDYDDSGVVDQGDLDLVLLHWGADATTAPASWRNDRPSGRIDQAVLDAVLLNWGKQTVLPPF